MNMAKALVDSGVCCSIAEARRLIAIAPEWKIRSMMKKKREACDRECQSCKNLRC